MYGNSEVRHKKTIEKDHGRKYFLTYDISCIKYKVKATVYIRINRTEKDETFRYANADWKCDKSVEYRMWITLEIRCYFRWTSLNIFN